MINLSEKVPKIPSDWTIENAKEQLLLISGQRPSDMVTDDPNDIPSLGGENITIDGFLTFNNLRFVNKQYFETTNKGKLKLQDILINKDGANTGKMALYNKNYFEKALVNEHVFIVRNKGKYYQPFLFYFLLSFYGQKQIQSRVTGSAQGGLNTSFTKALALISPSFSEQRAIASILSKVDETIEATENHIKAAEKLKKSLTQNLFTGKLKYDGTWRSENDFYADEKIGKVPKGWTFIKLKDMIELYQYGLNIPSSDDGSIPMFRMNNIIDGKIADSSMVYVQLSTDEFQKYKLEKDDILFNRTNSLDLVGKIGIFKLEGNYVFASYLIRIRTNHENNPDYINYYLNSYKGQVSLRSKATLAVSQANINAKNLINTFLPRPPKQEQEQIAKIIENIDILNKSKNNKVQTLKTLKKSLMQNLLIGKVRVDVEEINKLLEKA